MRSFQHYTTGCPEKTERFELLKNMLIYAMHSKTLENMSEHKVLYSNVYIMIVNNF